MSSWCKTRRKAPILSLFFIYLSCLFRSASGRIVGGGGRQHHEEEKKLNALSSLNVSTIVPSLRHSTELAHLSSLVYSFRSADTQDCSAFPLIYQEYIERHQPPIFIHTNATYHCHMYERNEQDTQVLIVSRDYGDGHGYVAVVYAGTDDFRSAFTDVNLLTTPFGPEVNGTHPLAPTEDVRVHAGFNNEVFLHGLFDRVKETVKQVKRLNPQYRIFTTGHSLGAANADLTAVAMKMQPEWKDELIVGVNFGSPKTGNTAWVEYVNAVEGLGIWRVVNGYDLVPRLPGIRFHHIGHTVQLDRKLARAFWLHEGDPSLGYRGVPFGWNSFSYALAPGAAVQHMIGHYTKYLDQKSFQDESTYYVDGFEKYKGYEDDDGMEPPVTDDDIWDSIPDDDIMVDDTIIQEFSEQYLALMKKEKDGDDLDNVGLEGLNPSSDMYTKAM
eukprot:CAMPEP_0204613948 /NCGR_PEP_ID=MMETSP0717-20131115/1837_1 /ASSEMBLY_ACC=CAM_ASM_000666 /TAXON_ID=230516 /ORGANISM="Chaetoceros curvisetus" /LENGTH=441 /DNA_ID=CAMNT_0051626531 /DNA_START=155 /DNA_END=1480 /DNA_ORIENTATION=-